MLELRRGFQASSWVGPRKPHLPFELRGKAGGCARVTAGPKRPHLGVCPRPNVPLKRRQGSRGCIPDSPGESGLISRGSKGLRSALESRRYLLEPTEWPTKIKPPVEFGERTRVWSPGHSGKEGPHLVMTGASWVFSSGSASVGFLRRYDEDLREPLVQCQGSQVSMRVARGSVSWL